MAINLYICREMEDSGGDKESPSLLPYDGRTSTTNSRRSP